MRNKIIYIPTITTELRFKDIKYENVLYSPNINLTKVFKAKNITIWDNHTFYWRTRYHKKDKHEKAREHYLWLINFIRNSYKEGIILVAPDVEWLKYREEIETLWYKTCKDYPQLIVPNTIQNEKELNIVGYALRYNTPLDIVHPKWNHCLGHIRYIECERLTYDSVKQDARNLVK